jgi:hypothetical protein
MPEGGARAGRVSLWLAWTRAHAFDEENSASLGGCGLACLEQGFSSLGAVRGHGQHRREDRAVQQNSCVLLAVERQRPALRNGDIRTPRCPLTDTGEGSRVTEGQCNTVLTVRVPFCGSRPIGRNSGGCVRC